MNYELRITNYELRINRFILIALLLMLSATFVVFSATENVKKGKLHFDKLQEAKYQEAQKRDEAITLLERVISEHPDNDEKAELLLRLAELYWEKSRIEYFNETERYDEAAALYNERKKGGEKDLELPVMDNTLSVETRRKAISVYQNILRNFKEYTKQDFVLFHLALNLFEVGSTHDAYIIFQRILKDYPATEYAPNVHLALGEYYFSKAQIKEAAGQYNEVIKSQDPILYGYSLYKLAWCHYNQNDYAMALDTFKKVVDFALKQEQLGGDKRLMLRNEALNDAVYVFADMGEIIGAEIYFKKVGGNEYFYKLLIRLGDIYKEQGKYEEAKKTYLRFLENAPYSSLAPKVHRKLLEIYHMGENAQEYTGHLFEFAEKYKEGSKWRDKNIENVDDVKGADLITEGLLRNAGSDYHKLAQEQKKEEYYAPTLEVYKKYLGLYPNSGHSYDIRFYLAEILFHLNDYNEAAKYYGQLVDAKGRDEHKKDAVYALVICYKKIVFGEEPQGGEGDKALDSIVKTAPEKRISIPAAENNLIDACNRFIKLYPADKESPKLTYLLARIYYKYNYYDDAAEKFKWLIENYPKTDLALLSANYVLGIYNLNGDWGNLRDAAQKFLDNEVFAKNAAFKADLQKILRGTSFQYVLRNSIKKEPIELGNEFAALEKKYPNTEISDKAIYNAALNYKTGEDLFLAFYYLNLLEKKYPATDLMFEALVLKANICELTADFECVASVYEKMTYNYPEKEESLKAIYNAAIYRKDLRNYSKSVSNIETYIGFVKDKKDEVAKAIMLKAGAYEEGGDNVAAIENYKKITRDFAEFSLLAFTAKVRIAAIYFKNLNYKESASLAREALSLYDEIKSGLNYTPDEVGESGFYIAYHEYAKFDEIKFKLPVVKLKQLVAQKLNQLKISQNLFIAVIETGSAKWGIASLYMIGKGYQLLSESLLNAPVPPNLTKDDLAQYKMTLEDQAFPVEGKAIEAYESCLKKAYELRYYDNWVRKAFVALNNYKPASYIPVEELEKPIIVFDARIDAKNFEKPNNFKYDSEELKKIADIIFNGRDSSSYNKAIKKIDDVLSKEPTNYVAKHFKAYCLAMLGEFVKAKNLYDNILKTKRDSVALINRANLNVLSGKYNEEQVFIDYLKAYEANKNLSSAILVNLAILYSQKALFKKAEDIVKELILKYHKEMYYYEVLARIYYLEEKYNLIEIMADMLGKLSANFYLELAISEIKTLKYSEAFKNLNNALGVDENFKDAILNIGYLYMYFGDYLKTIDILKKYDGYDYLNYIFLGVAYNAGGDYKNAKKYYEAILNKSFDWPRAHYLLGVLCYENLQDENCAYLHLRAYLSFSRNQNTEKIKLAKSYVANIEAKRRVTK